MAMETYSAPMRGAFCRNVGGIFIYQNATDYLFYKAQTMVLQLVRPRAMNIHQDPGQLKIWMLSLGLPVNFP